VLGYYRAIRSGRGARLVRERTRVPALYLHGRDDGCIGVELAAGVERGYARDVVVQLIARAGHFLHLEQPAEVAEHVVRFFARSA
jgi:pimeloyl-ACP methyl ester carboxylesterase